MDRRISLLRVTAAFMVILLHASGGGIYTFDDKWAAANFFNSITRACVPLFLMISGAMLLAKDEPLGAFFKKRFFRIIPPLLFWSVLYLWWQKHPGARIGVWISEILAGPTMYHLWYFYALIGLYAITPVIRKFYLNSTSNERLWFIATWLFTASIYPTIQSTLINPNCDNMGIGLLDSKYSLSYFGGLIGYFVLGAVMVESKGNVRTGVAIFSLASIGTMLIMYFASARINAPCTLSFQYLSPLVVVSAYGLFMAFMGMRPGKPSKLLTALADCSLGAYCIHIFILHVWFKYASKFQIYVDPWILDIPLSLGAFVACFTIIYFGRKFRPFRYVT